MSTSPLDRSHRPCARAAAPPGRGVRALAGGGHGPTHDTSLPEPHATGPCSGSSASSQKPGPPLHNTVISRGHRCALRALSMRSLQTPGFSVIWCCLFSYNPENRFQKEAVQPAVSRLPPPAAPEMGNAEGPPPSALSAGPACGPGVPAGRGSPLAGEPRGGRLCCWPGGIPASPSGGGRAGTFTSASRHARHAASCAFDADPDPADSHPLTPCPQPPFISPLPSAFRTR